jgi:hypothetical protein
MELTAIKRRIQRLERLSRGLAKEVPLWRGEKDLLLFGERRQYLREICKALAGADAARVVLVGVVRRIEGVRPTGQLPDRQ